MWSTGATKYRYDFEHKLIGIECILGGYNGGLREIAYLDTACSITVISHETAEIIGIACSDIPRNDLLPMKTRHGTKFGYLERLDIVLLSDPEMGNDITVNTSVLVLHDWEGPTMLGYTGFLDHLRIALDPGITPNKELFYFGDMGN